jgi:hypothetical protein
MVLGVSVGPQLILLGGALVFVLVAFQVLEGKRIIKFKGKLHMRVHRTAAWLILGFAAVHALVALMFLGYLPL